MNVCVCLCLHVGGDTEYGEEAMYKNINHRQLRVVRDLGKYCYIAPTQVKLAPFLTVLKLFIDIFVIRLTLVPSNDVRISMCHSEFLLSTNTSLNIHLNLHCLHQLRVFFLSSSIEALRCINPFYSEEICVSRHPCAIGMRVLMPVLIEHEIPKKKKSLIAGLSGLIDG